VKGTENLLVGAERIRDQFDEDTYLVQGKTLFHETGDGSTLVILARNLDTGLSLTRKTRTYTYTQMLAFAWVGGRFGAHATGGKMKGLISDLDLWPRQGPQSAPGGRAGTTVYAALVEKEGIVFKSYASRLLAYELP
jgi:hypothetical protein